MANYLGDFKTGQTVRFMWNSNGADGASITRSTDGSLLIYKDGGTAERTSANGITDTENFDGKTGVHLLAIDLSDNTDSGFYAAGSDYQVVLSAATIDTKTVNAVVAEFSIQNRYPFNATFAELAAIPTFPMALTSMWTMIYELAAHEKAQNTDGTFTLMKADGSTALAESAVSDSGTELTFGALTAP